MPSRSFRREVRGASRGSAPRRASAIHGGYPADSSELAAGAAVAIASRVHVFSVRAKRLQGPAGPIPRALESLRRRSLGPAGAALLEHNGPCGKHSGLLRVGLCAGKADAWEGLESSARPSRAAASSLRAAAAPARRMDGGRRRGSSAPRATVVDDIAEDDEATPSVQDTPSPHDFASPSTIVWRQSRDSVAHGDEATRSAQDTRFRRASTTRRKPGGSRQWPEISDFVDFVLYAAPTAIPGQQSCILLLTTLF